MITNFAFLKDLALFMQSEDALEEKKAPTRPVFNFQRLMNELEADRQDKVANYEAHLADSQQRVQGLALYHNTGLDELISILRVGKLLSPEELEKQSISFSMRSNAYGVSFHLQRYVFGHCQQANWIYGLYQIKFKPEVEDLPGALFLPGRDYVLEETTFKEHIMPIRYWREFLAERITVSKVNSVSYSRNIPTEQLPEFIFPDSIPFSLVESITCPTLKTKEKLLYTLAHELPSSTLLQNVPLTIAPREVLQWTNFR